MKKLVALALVIALIPAAVSADTADPRDELIAAQEQLLQERLRLIDAQEKLLAARLERIETQAIILDAFRCLTGLDLDLVEYECEPSPFTPINWRYDTYPSATRNLYEHWYTATGLYLPEHPKDTSSANFTLKCTETPGWDPYDIAGIDLEFQLWDTLVADNGDSTATVEYRVTGLHNLRRVEQWHLDYYKGESSFLTPPADSDILDDMLELETDKVRFLVTLDDDSLLPVEVEAGNALWAMARLLHHCDW